ncbi:MAG: PDZ domain-containing protein [Aliidiomarina sp.]|uniref:M61 family metallopeptidase n=1 Tax=Aliidiomarina sp. TaxID=1872439 RepID=UPI0025B96FD6|nr:PDZ domain-containing protein [Aliidiomarina sp.]MCH8501848.1 PDZ domain-containing protein [Aliidiomarina sp.]
MTKALTYRIQCDPLQHYFDVQITLPYLPQQTQFRLPTWLPGSYMIRDFAKHIVGFSVVGTTGALDYIRPDKSTWEIPAHDGQVVIEYRVYAFDLSVRTAWINHEFGFFNPSAVCLQCLSHHGPLHIEIELPHSSQWQIATGLTKQTGASTRYQAEDYDTLIDHPFLLGELTVIPFSAAGIQHELVLAGKHYADQSRLATDLAAICEQQIHFFNGKVPFQNYTFLTMVVGDGFGGLEHRNSTALLCARHTLEPRGNGQDNNDYLTFLSLCSHEYFHSWNVKQLRPKLFHPYDLRNEQYTEQLWFYEGITSYLDDYFVHHAGAMSATTYVQRLSETLTRALRGKGPQRQSVLESSRMAWTTFYQQNENSQNAISSYYSKGSVIALLADLAIRKISNGAHSLKDVMNDLYVRHAEDGTSQADLIASFARFGGEELAASLMQWLSSTQTPALEQWLQTVGLRIAPAVSDPITMQPSTKTETNLPVSFGAVLTDKQNHFEITRVFEDSAAAAAGLSPKDRIVAIDGIEATRANVTRAMQRSQPGQVITLHVFSSDQLHAVDLTWQAPVVDGFSLSIDEQARAATWLRLG